MTAWWVAAFGLAPLGLTVGGCPPRAPAHHVQAERLEALYERIRPAIVEVLVDGRKNGSGCIVDGKLVTAAHVTLTREPIEVLFADGLRVPATRLGEDLGHDLALFSLPQGDAPYPSLPLAEASPPVGTEVLLAGFPGSVGHVVLVGRIAQDRPQYWWYDGRGSKRLLGVAGRAIRGTSGGPWLDGDGRVVGLNVGNYTVDNQAAGIAHSAPPDAVRRLIEAGADVPVPTLWARFAAVRHHDTPLRQKAPRGRRGVIVSWVRSGGAGAQAGLRVGDTILAIDGTPTPDRNAFLDALRARTPFSAPRALKVWQSREQRYTTLTVRPERLRW